MVPDPATPTDMQQAFFLNANGEVFADGMGSHFSNSLNRIIRTRGIATVNRDDSQLAF